MTSPGQRPATSAVALDSEVGQEGSRRAPAIYEPGDEINRRYEVRSILGRGAFSIVYEVYDDVRDEVCALKIYGLNFGLDVARRELRALMNLSHPNIVSVIDVGRTSTRPQQWFLKSEFVSGLPLSHFTQNAGELLPFDVSLDIADQLLDALQVIHPDTKRIDALKSLDELTGDQYDELQRLQNDGLVHRDIKPENIMLTDDRRVKLLDFNIASSIGAAVMTVSGTPPYQPPEANLAAWDVSPDLFACGVVLFELLTHTHPYPDARPIVDVRPSDPRDVNPDLPVRVSETVRRMCEPLASARYTSAQEMRIALRNAIDEGLSPGDPGHRSFLAGATVQLAEWLRDARPRVDLECPEDDLGQVRGVPPGWSVSVVGAGAIVRVLIETETSRELNALRGAEGSMEHVSEPDRTPSGTAWTVDTVGLDLVSAVEDIGKLVVRAFLTTIDLAAARDNDGEVPSIRVGELPKGHHHIGWIHASDVRLPLVIYLPEPVEVEGGVALSAQTAAGTQRYPAVRGAYLWDATGSALTYESAVTADWVITASPSNPVGSPVEGGAFALTWHRGGAPMPSDRELIVRIEDRDGSAFVLVAAGDPSTTGADDQSETLDLDQMTIEEFLRARRGAKNTADAVSSFVSVLGPRGISWAFGRSESSADGFGGYAIASTGSSHGDQVAYLWPSTGQLDLRLSIDWARGRRFATAPRNAKANGYDVQLELRSSAAVEEALELMDIAVAERRLP